MRVVAASTSSALVAYALVMLVIRNQAELSALELALAITVFAGSFSLFYLGLAKALRISEVSAVLAIVRRK